MPKAKPRPHTVVINHEVLSDLLDLAAESLSADYIAGFVEANDRETCEHESARCARIGKAVAKAFPGELTRWNRIAAQLVSTDAVCRICGASYSNSEDDYDGLCPNCADSADIMMRCSANMEWSEAVALLEVKLSGRKITI